MQQVLEPDPGEELMPYRDPVVGLEAIGAMWEDERVAPDEEFELTSEIFASKATRRSPGSRSSTATPAGARSSATSG